MVKKIFITLVGLSILIVTYRGGVMVGSRRKMTIGGVVDQIEELTLVNNQPSSWLDLPVDYFSNDDVVWGSAGNWETEEGIRRFTSVALDNRIVYQSYPALNITFERYENEHRLLSIKSYEDVQKRFLENIP